MKNPTNITLKKTPPLRHGGAFAVTNKSEVIEDKKNENQDNRIEIEPNPIKQVSALLKIIYPMRMLMR